MQALVIIILCAASVCEFIAATWPQPLSLVKFVPELLSISVTALLILAQVLAVVTFLQNGWGAITFPYPLDYGDGPILDQVAA